MTVTCWESRLLKCVFDRERSLPYVRQEENRLSAGHERALHEKILVATNQARDEILPWRLGTLGIRKMCIPILRSPFLPDVHLSSGMTRSAMNKSESSSVATARTYYNSSPADKFYFAIWGGNDIHIGLYDSPTDSIAEASQRTIKRMAETVQNISSSTRVLDLGAGYGGAARWLAHRYGCKVTCLNLSEVQNERNRIVTSKEKLDHLIDVVDGDFEHLPFEDGAFDLIWSQDSFLHSSNRKAVVSEISRILVPEEGDVVFTDPMAAANASEEKLGPIKQRLSIDTFGSQGFYEQEFSRHGFEVVSFEGHRDQLTLHYGRVLEAIETQKEVLARDVPADYVEHIKAGLRNWVAGGQEEQLDWGIHHFRR